MDAPAFEVDDDDELLPAVIDGPDFAEELDDDDVAVVDPEEPAQPQEDIPPAQADPVGPPSISVLSSRVAGSPVPSRPVACR